MARDVGHAPREDGRTLCGRRRGGVRLFRRQVTCRRCLAAGALMLDLGFLCWQCAGSGSLGASCACRGTGLDLRAPAA